MTPDVSESSGTEETIIQAPKYDRILSCKLVMLRTLEKRLSRQAADTSAEVQSCMHTPSQFG